MKYYEKEKIKALPVQDAVGKVLLHDITEIVPDLAPVVKCAGSPPAILENRV
jgi:hypothetical protein